MTRIDFKYTSLSHLGFGQSVTRTKKPPRVLVDELSNFLRASGVQVTRVDASPLAFVQTPDNATCETVVNAIVRQEQAAFRANSFKAYKRIDKSQAGPACAKSVGSWVQYGFTAVAVKSGEGFTIRGTLDRSMTSEQPYTRPTFSSLFANGRAIQGWTMSPATQAVHTNLQTNFYIYIWRATEDQHTSVLAYAIPQSDRIEAHPGASTGPQMLNLIDGHFEANGVKSILAYVQQKDIAD